jgi:hypothetical protein
MASHKLTTYIAKNPPDAVRISNQDYFELIFFYHRNQKVKQHQRQKRKENQKIRKVLMQLVLIEIQMKEVLMNIMEKQ